MALVNKKQKNKYNKLVKKYFTLKRIIIFLLLLVIFLMFSDALKGVLLLVLFFPLSKYSVKVTAFVPHITLEQYTSSTLLMTYLYGPVVGALSGFVLGMYGYLSNSISKFLALTNVFVCAFNAVFIGVLLNRGVFAKLSFSWVFIMGILSFNLFAYLVFLYVDPDQLQNAIYRISHVLFNSLISVIFFNLIHNLFRLI